MDKKFKNTIAQAIYPYLRGDRFSIMVQWTEEGRMGTYRILKNDSNEFTTAYVFRDQKAFTQNALDEQMKRAYGVTEAQIIEIFNMHLSNFNQPLIRLETVVLRDHVFQFSHLLQVLTGFLGKLPKKEFRKKYPGLFGKVQNLAQASKEAFEGIAKNEDLTQELGLHTEFNAIMDRMGGIYPQNWLQMRFFLDNLLLSQGNFREDTPNELSGMGLQDLLNQFNNLATTTQSKSELEDTKTSLEWVLNRVPMPPVTGREFFRLYDHFTETIQKIPKLI